MSTKTEGTEKIKVVLADSYFLFRQGLCSALTKFDDIEVVGATDNREEVLPLLESFLPEVLILDYDHPALGGLELTRKIRLHFPKVSVTAIAREDTEEQIFQAIQAGAAAYFSRKTTPEELTQAIRRLSRGEYIINELLLTKPGVARQVLKRFQALSSVLKPIEPLLAPLSDREMEILSHIAHGKRNKEIAHALEIKQQTVKNHITSILRKLSVNDRTHAAVLAVQNGLIWVESQRKEPSLSWKRT